MFCFVILKKEIKKMQYIKYQPRNSTSLYRVGEIVLVPVLLSTSDKRPVLSLNSQQLPPIQVITDPINRDFCYWPAHIIDIPDPALSSIAETTPFIINYDNHLNSLSVASCSVISSALMHVYSIQLIFISHIAIVPELELFPYFSYPVPSSWVIPDIYLPILNLVTTDRSLSSFFTAYSNTTDAVGEVWYL